MSAFVALWFLGYALVTQQLRQQFTLESQRMVWARCLSRQCAACLVRRISCARCSKLEWDGNNRGMCKHRLIKMSFRMFSCFCQLSNIKDILNIHQIELEKFDIRARLQFSETYDILGSSLVRSIGVISQNGKILITTFLIHPETFARYDLRKLLIVVQKLSPSRNSPNSHFGGAPIRHGI